MEQNPKKKNFKSALVPVITGPGNDTPCRVAPARTALKCSVRHEDRSIANSRAIKAIRLNKFIRDVQVGRRAYHRSIDNRR